jgi:hypothetical protein
MSGAAQAHKSGDGLEVLAEYELGAPGHDRNLADAEFEEPLEALGVVEDINGDEVHALLRKKLLRSKTAASTRLGIEDELIDDGFHFARLLPTSVLARCHRAGRGAWVLIIVDRLSAATIISRK